MVVTSMTPTVHLPRLLVSLGMTPLGAPLSPPSGRSLSVLLDGRVLGEVGETEAANLTLKLRTLKALGQENVSKMCPLLFLSLW